MKLVGISGRKGDTNVNELEIHCKNKNIWDFEKGYQPKTDNIEKDEKGGLFADPIVLWLGEGIISLS